MRLRVINIGIVVAAIGVGLASVVMLVIYFRIDPRPFVTSLPEQIRTAKVAHFRYGSQHRKPETVSVSDKGTLAKLAGAMKFKGPIYSVPMDAAVGCSGGIHARVETETGNSLEWFMPCGSTVDFVIEAPFKRRFSVALTSQDFDDLIEKLVDEKVALDVTSTTTE